MDELCELRRYLVAQREKCVYHSCPSDAPDRNDRATVPIRIS